MAAALIALPFLSGTFMPDFIVGPMAITVLGGLVSSTLLNLLVLPALAQRFHGTRLASSPDQQITP